MRHNVDTAVGEEASQSWCCAEVYGRDYFLYECERQSFYLLHMSTEVDSL